MKCVVDSDILIDILRQQEKAKNFVKTIMEDGDTAHISVLTEAEVLSGEDCKVSDKKERTEELFSLFRVVDVTRALVRKGAGLRREHGMPLHDAIIAATAMEMDVPVYSRNRKHFRKIKGLKLKNPY